MANRFILTVERFGWSAGSQKPAVLAAHGSFTEELWLKLFIFVLNKSFFLITFFIEFYPNISTSIQYPYKFILLKKN